MTTLSIETIHACETDFEFGQEICRDVLTNIIIVLEKIFRCFNARQLNTCARVCKVWYNQAKREKESRTAMTWNYFKADHFEPHDFDVVLWWGKVKSFIQNSPIEPAFLLVFCSEAVFCHLVPWSPKKKRISKDEHLKSLFAPIVPKLCTFDVVVSDGIVGTDDKMKTEELEAYELALSLIMFSKSSVRQTISDFECVPFSLSHKESQALAKYWSEGSDKPPPFIQPMLDKKVRMVNLFCPMNGIDQEIGYSFLRLLECPLVAGGFVNSKLVKDHTEKIHSSDTNCFLSGFYLCGSQVQVASVLIKTNVDTEEQVDELIRSLKAHNLPETNSFGLMYACVGRGMHVYERRNIESGVFRRHFPSTPLVGLFGNGEVGCVYPSPSLPSPVDNDREASHVSSSENGKPLGSRRNSRTTRSGRSFVGKGMKANELKHPPKLLHAYTTVMCLVSLSAQSTSTASATAPAAEDNIK